MAPLRKPLRIQGEQAYVVRSAPLRGKVSQNFSDNAAKLEPMAGTGGRYGNLRVLGVGTNYEVLIRCCGVPAHARVFRTKEAQNGQTTAHRIL